MKLNAQTPKQSLNKAFLKQPVNRDEITLFKANLQTLLSKINANESEEHHKNFIRDFLKDSFYKSDYEINTKGRQDLVIHVGKDAQEKVGLILEAKKPTNKADMISADNPNKKALHELILYYLNERNEADNFELKNLVITDIYQWFIFDANHFDKQIYRNAQIKRLYQTYKTDKKDNPFFYSELQKIIANLDETMDCAVFDIRDYQTALNNADLKDDESLIELFKILSPHHLLKVPFADDSNKLDKNFYTELLHIIGLEEIKDKGKLKIQRKDEARRDAGSLIENAIAIIETKDSLHKVKNLESYGETRDERLFGVALELCLTWINRVLFLKLLEAQLIDYHKGNREYRFLDIAAIPDFDELFTLFHQVLAKLPEERRANIKTKYSRVPYLNSSLFEISELEADTLTIESLKDTIELSFVNSTILKDTKAKQNGLPTLEYLFKFLDAYDFASEGAEGIKENNRSLINASVLGKVFEKINGYKDGSIYTPGFITMYMCRQAIRLAVVQKFKDAYGWNISEFADIKNYLADRRSKADIVEFNRLVNSLRLCDPAVGSGHFLVSSLNEIIAVKSELGILADASGERFRDIEITVEADELTVFDISRNDFFKYQLTDGKPNGKEAQRLQKTLFHEKQTIIENCLFGVDINPNSVKICRLRLWIELLKNAYYKESSNYAELETLPNIDINIKEGDSLVSRFALDEDLKQVLSQVKYSIEDYRNFVLQYKETRDREKKRDFETKIKQIKNDFKTQLFFFSPERRELADFENQLRASESKQFLFGETDEEKAKRFEKETKLKAGIEKKKAAIKQIEENAIYKNAFEWRFEFPEVLDDDGNFLGFDVVIGNPPYFSVSKDAVIKTLKEKYLTFESTGDIYSLFYEKGWQLLKGNAILSFITSNKWLRADYGRKLRNFFITNTNPHFLIDFGDYQVFENAVLLANIIQFTKETYKANIRVCLFDNDFKNASQIQEYLTQNSFIETDYSDESWIAAKPEVRLIKKKVEKQGIKIKDWRLTIYRGILTGLNEAFYIDSETKDELIKADSKNAEIIKPLLRGEHIKKWKPEFSDLYLINTHNGLKDFDIPPINAEKDYPVIFEYLKNFETALIKRQDKGDHWSNLRNCAYLYEFDKPKIIYPNMTKFFPFVYDESGHLTNQKCFIITGENLKYLTAIFNSKLFFFCFMDNFPELLGETRELSKVFFEQIPIKQIEEKDQQPFVALVDQILELKKAGKDAQALEDEIDTLVYRLYDLTDDEIKIVEGRS